MKKDLITRLNEGPIMCAEGYLFAMERRGYLSAGPFVPEVVLEHPEVVTQLHREFIRAGSDVVQAFTYYGHREKLRIIGKEHFELYYVGDESASSDEFKDIREKNFAFWQEVMNEDVTAIEGMQNGRNSPAYNGGNFSPVMDTPTLMFHKWVATNLTK